MKKVTLIGLILAVFAVSCETDIDYRELYDTDLLVMNAYVSPDTNVMLHLSRSFTIDEAPVKIGIYDYDAKYTYVWDYMRYLYELALDTLGQVPEYVRKYNIDDGFADVYLTVNGNGAYKLFYNSFYSVYECDYTPKSGDKLIFTAEGFVDSLRMNKQRVISKMEIPNKPEFEILDVQKLYSRYLVEDQGTGLWEIQNDLDSIVRIRLKIRDNHSNHNFYRLKVRSYSLYHKNRGFVWDWSPGMPGDVRDTIVNEPPSGELVWHMNEVYSSDDILFRDDRIKRGFMGWQRFFSPVFDDNLFKNGEYEVEVDSRMVKAYDRKIMVELQAITEDYYNYLKGYLIYRVTTEDDNVIEGVYIHSNVQNGFGIVAGVNSDVHVIDL